MTMALRALQQSGIRLRGDVTAEYVMDEELTGNGTLACVLRGYYADAGICCETSSMCVQPASIGRIWFEIRVKGKSAGIQKRYEGVNAIELGYLIQQAVAAFERTRTSGISHPLYPDMLSSIPCMVGSFRAALCQRLSGCMCAEGVPGDSPGRILRASQGRICPVRDGTCRGAVTVAPGTSAGDPVYGIFCRAV